MTNLLADFPVNWTDQRIRELRDALTTTIYRDREIEQLVVESGVPPGNINWSQPARGLWFDAINEAAGQRLLPELVAAAARRQPAIARKVDELLAATPLVAAPVTGAEPTWTNFGHERQIVEGMETLLDISFLQHGLDRARSVCRLTVDGRFYGTGFRVGRQTLLTNHHVLFDKGVSAAHVRAEFGYELGTDGALRLALGVVCDATSIRGEPGHDFAVIRAPMPDDIPILPIRDAPNVEVDDRVYIIQHPHGLPKKIALHHNLVRHVDDNVIQYWTDTEAGSSGSPVFNGAWQVVGLHHWWLESKWDDGVAYRNQGRRIARVVERLTALGIDFED